ncbi:polyprenyl diphosphate synthase [Candidatus Pelagibacter sp. HIMB1485]|uniref:polyprenyl diphosphate synthase n=1 Tax=Candidatus Pelagibacter sp. HIMB1485 TaxID=3415415 RepID=UPI003F8322EE
MNSINHVAIIMDGNGRWGLKNYNSRNKGHKAGLKTVESIIKVSIKYKIKFLTLYAFSTENWKRPKSEINYLFKLLENFLELKIKKFHKNNIKLKILGEKMFSKKLNNLLINSEKLTKKNSKLQINLALNYGSRKEIVNATKKLNSRKLEINEKNISKNLYTSNIPDPDILIRTGKTNRLSNFLLWQISYTEIFFSNKLWPDFNEKDFIKIIKNFQKIKRNFGEI